MLRPEEIEQLMTKVISGNASKEEKQMLKDWRDESPVNDEDFQAFEMAWKLLDKPGSVDREAAWEKVTDRLDLGTRVIPLYQQTWMRIAASVAIFFIIGFAIFRIVGLESKEQYLALAQGEEVKLEDESIVTLKEGALLSYTTDFGEKDRNVDLEGSAYFKVERDEEIPFIVHTDYGNVKVLGTEFQVETDSKEERTLVYVASGKVLVFPDNYPDKGVEITLNEAAEVRPGQVRKIQVGNTNIIAWKSKKIRFRNENLQDVFNQLSDIYDVEIQYSNTELGSCSFSGRFTNQDLEDVLDQLSDIYEFSYSMDKTQVNIEGGGC